MINLSFDAFAEPIRPLLGSFPVAPLDDNVPENDSIRTLRKYLRTGDPLLRDMPASQPLTSGSKRSQSVYDCLCAAMWLLAGDLERAHQISQAVDTRDGSFWHGVMHRREGDFSNAQYWFRKVGDHPAYPRIHDAVREDPLVNGFYLANDAFSANWEPCSFVNLCARATTRSNGRELEFCKQIQWLEWQVMVADLVRRLSSMSDHD